MSDKLQIRPKLKHLRSNIDSREILDKLIEQRALKLIQEFQPKSVFCYVSFGTEVDTKAIIKELLPKTLVLVPHTQNNYMKTAILKSQDKLEPDSYGNIFSFQPEFYEGKVELAIVPMLGFNSQLYRIGYGGGYYDRYLAKNKIRTIGLAYDQQKIDFLPHSHDIPLDIIVTQSATLKAHGQ